MSNEVIERVAQALAEASGWGLEWSQMEHDGSADYESRDYWRKMARAAVESMLGHDGDGRWLVQEIGGDYTVTPFLRWLETSQMAWTPVNGTGCPVDANKLVAVRWRNWQEYMGLAGGFQWHWAKKPQNEAWDIIAYMTL